MYEDLAWNSFEKTGDIQSFLEYKEMLKLKSNLKFGNILGANQVLGMENVEGVLLNEVSKSQGNSDKGNSI